MYVLLFLAFLIGVVSLVQFFLVPKPVLIPVPLQKYPNWLLEGYINIQGILCI